MRPLDREILRLALPSILAGITVPLVGMVDIAVAGHLDGTTAAFIGGISVGSMLFDLLYWNFGFLRAGTGGLAAQAFGRADPSDCARILVRGLGLALGSALILLLLQVPFTRLAFLIIDSTPEVRSLALRYFCLRIWAAPATLSLMALRGWFVGMQDTVSSMKTDLIVNTVNIAASILLTLGIGPWRGLGFPGIALGTVVAQYTGLVFALAVVLRRFRTVFDGFTRADLSRAFRRDEIRSFSAMNGDLFLRSLGLTGIYIGFTSLSAGLGDLMLASGSILMKLLMVFSFFTDGFAYAGQALTGRFIGEQNRAMLRKTVRRVFGWSMGIGVSFIFIYWAGGLPMVRLMTSAPDVVESCRQFLPWLILMPPLGCAAFTWDGIYEGATASRPIRDAMLAAMAAFFLCWLAGQPWLAAHASAAAGLHLLLGAYFAHLLIRTVWLTVAYRRQPWRS